MQNTQISPEQDRESSRKSVTILGVKIDSSQKHEVLKQIRENIENNKKFYAVTPYSEMFVMAAHDSEYLRILNNAAVSLPDGVVVKASERYFQMPVSRNPFTAFLQWVGVLGGIIGNRGNKGNGGDMGIETIKGRDFFFDLMDMANTYRWNVVLVGDGKESAQHAKRKLETKYSSAMIRAFSGPILDETGMCLNDHEKEIESNLIQTINSLTPQLLFIGFGPPKQEKWIDRTLGLLRVTCAVGIGGTFDYINGTMPKPPRWMETHGLEWLWRLVNDPRRIGRMWRAIFVFSMLIIREKVNSENDDEEFGT